MGIFREQLKVQDLPILIYADGHANPFHCLLEATDVTKNFEGYRTLPAGLFVGRWQDPTALNLLVPRYVTGELPRYIDRALPRARVLNSVLNTGTVIRVRSNIAGQYTVFKVGDLVGKFDEVTGLLAVEGTRAITVITPIDNFSADITVASAFSSGGGNYFTANSILSVAAPARYLGVTNHSYSFDSFPDRKVSPVSKSHGVYKSNLPYYDAHIAAKLEEHLMIIDRV